MAQVSVRELRQRLSVYLERVMAGESFSVTKRGEPVAVLAPLPGRGSPLERLVAEGRVTRPTGRVEDLPPPLEAQAGEEPLSKRLDEQREESL